MIALVVRAASRRRDLVNCIFARRIDSVETVDWKMELLKASACHRQQLEKEGQKCQTS